MAVTCDTGAQVSVVPLECVAPDQLTGKLQKVKNFHGSQIESEVCHVIFKIGEREFDWKAVAVDGGVINWTPILKIPYQPRDEMLYILDKMNEKFKLQEQKQLYLPPVMVKGTLLNGSMVSMDGDVSLPVESVTKGPVGVDQTIKALSEKVVEVQKDEFLIQEPCDSIEVVSTEKAIKVAEEEKLAAKKKWADMMSTNREEGVEQEKEVVVAEASGDHGKMEEEEMKWMRKRESLQAVVLSRKKTC